jgi:hypothetical protein
MRVSTWIEKNNQELIEITKRVINHQDYLDIYQMVVLSLLEKENRINKLSDKELTYFFIRALKNQFFSKTSPYHYQYRKPVHMWIEILNQNLEEEIDYKIKVDLDWVHNQLKDLSWFDRDLFLLWMELKTISAVSEQTTIPLNSVGKYIRGIKKKLLDKYNQNFN